MNASPVNINPIQSAQPQPTTGRQQDSTSPDVPFSQVLSSEIAQHKRSNDAKKESAPQADSAVKSQSADSADASASATPITQGKDAEPPSSDPLQTESPATSPETLLALAIQPDQLRPAPTSKGDALSRQSAALDAKGSTTLDAHKGRSPKGLPDPRALQSRQIADDAAGAQKFDATMSGKAAATAFSGQLAAARQPDAMKTQDVPSDLMGNSAMRVTLQAPLETPTALNGVAANRLAPSVGSTAWGQALGEKVVWMAAGAQQTASLTLNPPNMGPLQIVLNITNDQATASFFSAQPEVRQALEAAFPRLREMMDEAGIQLGQATVSADTPQQNDPSDRQAQRVAPPFPGMDAPSASGLLTVNTPVQQSGRGLIDTFA